MSKDLELFKFARLYLGEENWDLIKKTSEKELNLFKKHAIDLSTSYIVIGNADILNKYRAFYLTRCVKNRPLYMQCSMHKYAEELTSDTKDEYGLNIDQDLIFLYLHKYNISTLGNSEKWLMETTLNRVADRNREGLVTIILSEVRAPLLESSGELKVINLSGIITSTNQKEALKELLYEDTKSNSSEFTCFD